MNNFEFWAKRCRQNTGSHMLDSGSHYGYHYQAPPATESAYPICYTVGDDGSIGYASISTEHYLTSLFDAGDELAKAYTTIFNSEYGEVAEFLLGMSFHLPTMYPYGYMTYNHQNDFTQDFSTDFFMANDKHYAIVKVHCGCDIRGGWSTPVCTRVKRLDDAFDMEVSYYCDYCEAEFCDYNSIQGLLDSQNVRGLSYRIFAGLWNDDKCISAKHALVCPKCNRLDVLPNHPVLWI